MRFRLCLDCRHKNTLKNPENGCFLTKTTVFSWSEWGDSNSRHLEPKSSALPTGPHPDIYFFFLRKVVKHVVKFHFLPPKADCLWKFLLVPQRLFCFCGKLSTSRAPAPKPGALPTGPHPDMQLPAAESRHTLYSIPPLPDCQQHLFDRDSAVSRCAAISAKRLFPILSPKILLYFFRRIW